MEKAAKSPRHIVTVMLVLANVFVLTLYAGGWSHTPSGASGKAAGVGSPLVALGGAKKIIREPIINREPVEIGDVKVKGKAVKFGDEIDGDETWLRDVSVKVRNVSDKTITCVSLAFVFPDNVRADAVITHHVFLGRRPDFFPLTSRNEPLRLAPGESATVSLTSHFDEIKSLVEPRYGWVGNVNQVAVNLSDALFEDGTLYSGGAVFRRNPDASSPRKWLIIRNPQ